MPRALDGVLVEIPVAEGRRYRVATARVEELIEGTGAELEIAQEELGRAVLLLHPRSTRAERLSSSV